MSDLGTTPDAELASLVEQALAFAGAGDVGTALAVTRRQVAVARQLKADAEKQMGWDSPCRELAEALHALASYQLSAGAIEDAMSTATEAVSEWGRDTFVFAPQQGQSLGLLSVIQSRAGLREEALVTAEEAWRRVSTWNHVTERWLRRLKAGMATDLAARRGDCGLLPQAIAAAREAIDLWRQLVAEDAADTAHLARARQSLAVSLWRSGAKPEALMTMTDAVRTYRLVPLAQAAECSADLATAEKALETMHRG